MKTAMMSKRLLTAIAAACLMAAPAAAHRIGIPVTSIDWNAASGTWEVAHRLSVHDFDKAMAGKISPSALYETDEGMALIEAYANSAFTLSGNGAELSFVGAELDRDAVWIYYELSATDAEISIDSDLLMETAKTSHALVNIETPNGVQTLIFTPQDGPKQIELVRPAAP